MNWKYYIVKFTNGKTVFVRAMTEEEAIILAQATMIKNGYSHFMFNVLQVYDSRMKDKADLIA